MAAGDRSGGAPEGRGKPSSSYTGPTAHRGDIAVVMSEVARTLQDERTVDDTLRAIVHAAITTVPGAQYAGLSVIENRRMVRTRAATDELVEAADRVQYETGEGPCLDALYDHQTVRVNEMANEARWPAFSGRAARLDVGSMLSFQLYVEENNLGALNLYARQTRAFDDDSEQVGLLFATHAAVAMAGAQKQHQLNHAMSVRDLIGQAKGILMERHKLTGEQAFALLVRTSQNSNTRLTDVAVYLVESGELKDRARH